MIPVKYNPGIFGFVKAHRHPSGCAVVMSQIEENGRDFTVIFWVKRLIHNAKPFLPKIYRSNESRLIEETYQLYLDDEIPPVIPDRQKNRVYDWEDYCTNQYQTSMTWEGCEEFLRSTWAVIKADKSCPKLINNRRYNTAIALNGQIHLPKGDKYFWCKPIILHEIAHEITPLFVHHGPLFVRNLIGLYHNFLDIDKKYLEEKARHFGVCFDDRTWL